MDDRIGPKAAVELREILIGCMDSTSEMPLGWMFQGLTMYFDGLPGNTDADNPDSHADDALSDFTVIMASRTARFGGATIATELRDVRITHVVVNPASPKVAAIKETLSWRRPLPRLVTTDFVDESWRERTLLDEERFVPR
jgi:DNA ligase-4